MIAEYFRGDVCRLVGAACRAGVNGLSAPAAAVGAAVAVGRSTFISHPLH